MTSEIRPSGQLTDEFNKLTARYEDDTRYVSNVGELFGHPSITEIIKLGKKVLTLVLWKLVEAVDSPPDFIWFYVLREITGEDPAFLLGSRDSIYAKSEIWVEWGVENGYIL